MTGGHDEGLSGHLPSACSPGHLCPSTGMALSSHASDLHPPHTIGDGRGGGGDQAGPVISSLHRTWDWVKGVDSVVCVCVGGGGSFTLTYGHRSLESCFLEKNRAEV